jgi:hypothetical protein
MPHYPWLLATCQPSNATLLRSALRAGSVTGQYSVFFAHQGGFFADMQPYVLAFLIAQEIRCVDQQAKNINRRRCLPAILEQMVY